MNSNSFWSNLFRRLKHTSHYYLLRKSPTTYIVSQKVQKPQGILCLCQIPSTLFFLKKNLDHLNYFCAIITSFCRIIEGVCDVVFTIKTLVFLNTIFYKVDLEISNNPQICRILAYLPAEKSRQEFCKFLGYLKFPHQLYKKWPLIWCHITAGDFQN